MRINDIHLIDFNIGNLLEQKYLLALTNFLFTII